MHKKNGKVYATLTEVKNLIGDVFAAVDEHGEVAITSYNKTKYIISKAPSPEMSELVEEIPVKKSKKREVVPSQSILGDKAIEPVIETAPTAETINDVIRSAQEAEVAPTPLAAPTATSELITLLDIFKNSNEREIFNRFADKETAWVNHAKLNF